MDRGSWLNFLRKHSQGKPSGKRYLYGSCLIDPNTGRHTGSLVLAPPVAHCHHLSPFCCNEYHARHRFHCLLLTLLARGRRNAVKHTHLQNPALLHCLYHQPWCSSPALPASALRPVFLHQFHPHGGLLAVNLRHTHCQLLCSLRLSPC